MDEKTLSMEVFVRSLTEDQLDVCESDEKRLGELFSAGWSEANSVRFARTMFHARRVKPDVTVEAVFEDAFRFGLVYIGDETAFAQMLGLGGDAVRGAAKKQTRKSRLSGVGV